MLPLYHLAMTARMPTIARVKTAEHPEYLAPYHAAIRKHGGGFRSLLWDSLKSQAARFNVMTRLCQFHGNSVLDVGCGRADLLEFLISRGIEPDHYTGLEAMDTLVNTAREKQRPNSLIVQADFVAEPARLFTGADIIVFSGSLNMLESHVFYATVRTAHAAAVKEVAFNFLSSPYLAGADYLHWHRPLVVRKFAEELGGDVEISDDYLEGDYTVRIRKIEH